MVISNKLEVATMNLFEIRNLNQKSKIVNLKFLYLTYLL